MVASCMLVRSVVETVDLNSDSLLRQMQGPARAKRPLRTVCAQGACDG